MRRTANRGRERWRRSRPRRAGDDVADRLVDAPDVLDHHDDPDVRRAPAPAKRRNRDGSVRAAQRNAFDRNGGMVLGNQRRMGFAERPLGLGRRAGGAPDSGVAAAVSPTKARRFSSGRWSASGRFPARSLLLYFSLPRTVPFAPGLCPEVFVAVTCAQSAAGMKRSSFLAASATIAAATGAAPALAQAVPGGTHFVERKADFDQKAFDAAVGRPAEIRQLWEAVAFKPGVWNNVKNAINGLQFGFGYAPDSIAMAWCGHGPSTAYVYGDYVWQKYQIGDVLQTERRCGRYDRDERLPDARKNPSDPKPIRTIRQSMYQDRRSSRCRSAASSCWPATPPSKSSRADRSRKASRRPA